ncbi:hypothetical protein QVD17_10698 [Tagetes erecta]|uniref:Uncharacterized protein n=1 Tax=Tagetes erecta TaxID=13708 RepID=A0AAD8L6V3_TARER|nr:hypothetical protein QVD17_10698 [Tagetes erecta]
MDADERLMALKKAYAEIILNTAKEAAARIMVSERKATQFEYELKTAKDDAIRMLLRLKQMMDAQIREAAIVSCSQQNKIDELEAQLQEAEDIVKDLREELRAVEAKLERFSQRKEIKHTVEVNNLQTHEPITFPPSEVQHNSNIDQTSKSQRLYNSLLPLKKSLIGDLPSIILRSKETDLYRNGCTQRIRACECTPPDVKPSFSTQTNDLNGNIKPESTSKEDEVVEKEVVLEQIKEMDLAAENSCLTSPNSTRHSNDTTIDENLARTCNSQSTSGEEVMPVGQEKGDIDLPSVSAVSKVCKISEVPNPSLTDRVIKYTFQRKRKRGALIEENGSSEQNHENQTVHVGPVKVNLIGESTPEKIRLEQVAHQLISLSDKKWWMQSLYHVLLFKMECKGPSVLASFANIGGHGCFVDRGGMMSRTGCWSNSGWRHLTMAVTGWWRRHMWWLIGYGNDKDDRGDGGVEKYT